MPHSCDFSLHLGGWGRESLPGTGGGIGDASQARGQGDGNFGKGNHSPAWGAELGIPPRLGTWDISPAREAGRPMESSNLPEHVFSNLCRAPIPLVISHLRRQTKSASSPQSVSSLRPSARTTGAALRRRLSKHRTRLDLGDLDFEPGDLELDPGNLDLDPGTSTSISQTSTSTPGAST